MLNTGKEPMITYEVLSALVVVLETLVTDISALSGTLALDGAVFSQASAGAIAALATSVHQKLDAIDQLVARIQTAPPAIRRDRAIALASPANAAMIVRCLANSERYAREMLETANELL